ncbi:Lipoprotein-releasing system transmembrane protein LolE [Caulifigura coniformis]|uniref:Lipoprotein-releasing system transmembrane protein LolE n=1 Tax=Caulifigura coniformis TaxID=2527983 RepID=A0A517SGN5_9PLAN|nr:FtsX-like permease family protein [Caulifigura coniformis]QDT55284.1 Lipoprotein-releasing system transmembrane protein LolE [Caulifigura coniformis]
MYKLLLSSRYLRTRFIALASIVSVMLGVATMIVVNSVMTGFSMQMRERIHGILADVMIETQSADGEDHPEHYIRAIEDAAGQYIEAITPTVEVYGMMTFHFMGMPFNRPVTLIGIDPHGKDLVSPLKEYLRSRQTRHEGETLVGPERPVDEPLDWSLSEPARKYRENWAPYERNRQEMAAMEGELAAPNVVMASADSNSSTAVEPADVSPFGPVDGMVDPFGESSGTSPDSTAPQPARLFVGEGLFSFLETGEDGKPVQKFVVLPGEDVSITTVKQGKPEPVSFKATVVDLFKSGMSEYDSTLVFCSLEHLQKFRGMMSPPEKPGAGATQPQIEKWMAAMNGWQSNENLDWRNGKFTTLQIKLKDPRTAGTVVDLLRRCRDLEFHRFQVKTWEQKQGPLLEAVEVESAILNVLLFLIITVAGFGILAIFYMIVVEKTRDIGILKALGASSRGVMSIFLGYGLALGIVGSGVGVGIGLLFVHYINEIEHVISWILGRKVFDENIYYFHEIPTVVQPGMVAWVALGAVVIAVLASVLPARRASSLHPVRALRFE